MIFKWNRFIWRVLPPSVFIALIVTGIYAATKLEFNNNLCLTFDFNPSTATRVKLYFDAGDGFSEKMAVVDKALHAKGFQTLRFALPAGDIKRIRLDPSSRRSGNFSIRNMRIVDRFDKEIGTIPLSAFIMNKQMKLYEKRGDVWVGETIPGAYDAQIVINHERKIEKALNYPLRTKFQHILAAYSKLLTRIFLTVLLLCVAVLGLTNKTGRG